MEEVYEIQLLSKYLSLVDNSNLTPPKFPNIAVTLRGVVGDPLFIRIGELDQHLRESRLGVAFGSWKIRRTYSAEEFERAQLFLLNVPMTHLAAEEYGTQYRDARDYEHEAEGIEHVGKANFRIAPHKIPCGICFEQVGPLRVPFHKFKKAEDIYRLWGGELIVSMRFADLISWDEFSGCKLFPISDIEGELTSPLEFTNCPAGLKLLSIAAAKGMDPKDWSFWCWLNEDAQKPILETIKVQQKRITSKRHKDAASRRNLGQLVLQSKPLEVSQRSRFGATPFDTGAIGHQQCDAGEVAGLRLISSMSVISSSWDGSDLCRTGVYVGARQGLFRPHQLFVVSKRFLKGLQQVRMKGFQFEVVEMV